MPRLIPIASTGITSHGKRFMAHCRWCGVFLCAFYRRRSRLIGLQCAALNSWSREISFADSRYFVRFEAPARRFLPESCSKNSQPADSKVCILVRMMSFSDHQNIICAIVGAHGGGRRVYELNRTDDPIHRMSQDQCRSQSR